MKKRILSIVLCACMALSLTFGLSRGTTRSALQPKCDLPAVEVSQ